MLYNAANEATTFVIIYTNLYALVLTLSTQDNSKPMPKSMSNKSLDYLIDPSFQVVSILFCFIT